ncbi:MAG: hypothetical protein GEU98_22570 [Pseudonocardiaceae bacterium]|nr:hypothetical protein [Pseudonocardiaceae bacterium]
MTAWPAISASAARLPAAIAQGQPGGGGAGQGEDFGKSSPVGLLLLGLFLIAVIFLVRSMTKHLRRIPASFGGESDEATSGESPGSEAGQEGNEETGAETDAESSTASPPHSTDTTNRQTSGQS